MKYIIEMSTKFKKDYKLARKRGYDTSLLKDVIDILADGKTLPEKYCDHPLCGSYSDTVNVIFFPIGCLFTELKKNFCS